MTGFSLTHVHLSCFVASYTVALLLELLRLILRSPTRILGTLGFTAAGILAQTIYIALRTSSSPDQTPPLSGWFDWLLLVAWGVALAYLLSSLRRPQAAYGVFMLPLVLALIAIAALFRHAEPFPRGQAQYVWGMVHGGPEGAIYKSTDAGTTWRKITSGIPKEDLGRIGLAVAPADPDVVSD